MKKKTLLDHGSIIGFFRENAFLSTTYRSDIVWKKDVVDSDGNIVAKANNKTYRSVEVFYQAVRTGDNKTEALGDNDNWKEVAPLIMEAGLRMKYDQSTAFRAQLLNTGLKYLENADWDTNTFWGTQIKSGEGENFVGKMTMKIREEYASQSPEESLCYGFEGWESLCTNPIDAAEIYLDKIEEWKGVDDITILAYKKKVITDQDLDWYGGNMLDDLIVAFDEAFAWEDGFGPPTKRMQEATIEYMKIIREEYKVQLCDPVGEDGDIHMKREELLPLWRRATKYRRKDNG